MFPVPPHIEDAGEEEITKVPEGHPVTWSCLTAGEHHAGWHEKVGADLSLPLGCRANRWLQPMTREWLKSFFGIGPGFAVGLSGKCWGGGAHVGNLFHNISSDLSQMELNFL